jgi:hypothetical protein
VTEPLERIEPSSLLGRTLLVESIEEAAPEVYNMVEKAILATLTRRTNATTGIAFPGLSKLAHWVSTSKGTARATVRRLNERGALEIERRKADDGLRDTSNAYRVCCEMKPKMVALDGTKRNVLAPHIVVPNDVHAKTQRGGLRSRNRPLGDVSSESLGDSRNCSPKGEGAKTDPSPRAKTDPPRVQTLEGEGAKTDPESSDLTSEVQPSQKERVMRVHERAARSNAGQSQTDGPEAPSVTAKPIARTTKKQKPHEQPELSEADLEDRRRIAMAGMLANPEDFGDATAHAAAAERFFDRYGVPYTAVLIDLNNSDKSQLRKASGDSR